MPGNAPDGLCDLLSRGLKCFNAEPKVYGIIHDYDDAANICEKNSAVFVGIPIQMRRLALLHPELRPKRVLLSADYCAPAVINTKLITPRIESNNPVDFFLSIFSLHI